MGAASDRCGQCQASLAPDQQYCVNCGERRGRARFDPSKLAAPSAPAQSESSLPPRRQHPRMSSGATLVTGVATLLIAMGVGVLIGHYSNSSSPIRTPAAQVITVGSGAAPGTGAATGASTTAASHSGKKVTAKPTVVHVTAKTARAATAAASKVLGSSANKSLSKNVQQQVGGSCSGGAGCQNGRFTGNFFPGG